MTTTIVHSLRLAAAAAALAVFAFVLSGCISTDGIDAAAEELHELRQDLQGAQVELRALREELHEQDMQGAQVELRALRDELHELQGLRHSIDRLTSELSALREAFFQAGASDVYPDYAGDDPE